MSMSPLSESRVNAALVGCGGIARSQHLPNLTRAPNIRLQAVCDVNRAAAESAARDYGVPRVAERFEELLTDPAIDLIVVATKEDFQVPLTCQALAAGKHVYVEKPLAATPEACAEVVAAQARGDFAVLAERGRRALRVHLKGGDTKAGQGRQRSA